MFSMNGGEVIQILAVILILMVAIETIWGDKR
jgi:hypothetical protein